MNIDEESKKSINYVMGMSFITKIFLIVKGLLIEDIFSSNLDFNNYNIAFTSIILLSSLLADGIVLSVIKGYGYIEKREGEEILFQHIDTLISWTLVIGGALTFIITLVLKILNSNPYFILGLPIIVLSIIRILLTGFLQMRLGFFAGPRGNVARSFLYVLYLVTIGNKLGLEGLMIFGVITIVVQILIAINGAENQGYNFNWNLKLELSYIRSIVMGGVLTTLILLMYKQITANINQTVFMDFFLNVFVSSILIVIYPLLCHSLREEGVYKFNEVLKEVLIFLMKIIIPISIVVLINSDLIKEVFNLGRYRSNLFLTHSIALFSMAIFPLAFRAMMSYEDYLMPVILLMLNLLINAFYKGKGLVFTNIIFLVITIYSLFNINKKTRLFKSEGFKGDMGSILKYNLFLIINLSIFNLIFTKLVPDIKASSHLIIVVLTIIFGTIYNKILKNKKVES